MCFWLTLQLSAVNLEVLKLFNESFSPGRVGRGQDSEAQLAGPALDNVLAKASSNLGEASISDDLVPACTATAA